MRFFNLSRFKLLKGTRFTKYLVYAVGEIILVVIGIMIAVAINNFKQEKADKKELERIISLIKTDLEADLVETTEVLKTAEINQKLTTKILYNPKFKDSIKGCEDCRYIMAGVYVPSYNYNGYNLLVNFNKDVKTNNKQVDSILKFYGDYKRESFEIRNKMILDEIVDHMKTLRNQYDWFSDWFNFSKCEAECQEYFSGQNYINRLTYYEAIFFDDFLYGVSLYKEDLEKTLAYLNKYLE